MVMFGALHGSCDPQAFMTHRMKHGLHPVHNLIEGTVIEGTVAADFLMTTARINDKAQLRRLQRRMEFRDALGGYGTVLPFAEGTINLPAGMRLLEVGQVKDMHDLSSLSFPCDLTFFDTKVQAGLNFVCPYFGIVGFGIHLFSCSI